MSLESPRSRYQQVADDLRDGIKRGDYPPDLPRHSVSVGGAVIREDGRVLAIKRRDNGAWVQPGGVVELDEDPRDAVRHELQGG
ncbi:NUDIX hydrolase [Actinomadura alba]|uniref:NUDIX domain-containing protein n=1 Tax=Actinomadura alba TaxID=406431 RepID=A0ABR7LHZ9_9ACTN|nr:NUDIX domain-containing protein [Actinomadura alba]